MRFTTLISRSNWAVCTVSVTVTVCVLLAGFMGCTGQPVPANSVTQDESQSTSKPQPAGVALPENTAAGKSHALLVGCTTYDSLGQESALRGPVNDVDLMRQLLIERFAFQDKNIRRLTEESGAHGRPLKVNIARELAGLSDRCQSGDRVVILLSGHGSQQPNDDPADVNDPEPDGLDEIFCPADIKGAKDPDHPYALNAFTDDELRSAIKSIRAKGAFVWIIVDSCHSGSAVRGNEVYRQLPPERLVGKEALAKAVQRSSSQTRGITKDDPVMDAVGDQGGLVAIYAAQPHEPTLEMMLPRGADDSEWRGLLTYTMVKVLTSAEAPLSYRELVQRIHGEYVQGFGRLGPTPLIEGLDQHQEVLGQSELSQRSKLFLARDKKQHLTLNGGRLHGFAKGTVFAVFPPPGAKESKTPLGYVKSDRAELTSSHVTAVKYNDQKANEKLPIGGRCEPVEIQYGSFALSVGFEEEAPDEKTSATESIPDVLRQIEKDPTQRIQYVADVKQADWIVRRTKQGELFLVPSEGWTKSPGETYFGPAPTEHLQDWLRERLMRVSRVKSLLKLCDASERQGKAGWNALLGAKKACDIQLKLLAKSDDPDEWKPIDWTERKWKLNDGEQVTLTIKNTGSGTIDFSALFIDSKSGITQLFPPPGVVADNRLEPGQSYSVGPLEVEASTLGLEHLMVIAAKAEGQPMDFTWLGQDALEAAPAGTRAGLPGESKDPLGDLFRQAMSSKQTVRGMRVADTESTCLRAISWQTVKE
ncbi:MAG: peptidase caspase catalytic subunit p20 [Planctomycetaceae bacterium]|nr:peptidase caspase catalytic subunit p20 [Planctomycetaceae bacterium]